MTEFTLGLLAGVATGIFVMASWLVPKIWDLEDTIGKKNIEISRYKSEHKMRDRIKTPIENYKDKIREKDKRIAELEQERDECAIALELICIQGIRNGKEEKLTDICAVSTKALARRDLEQQAKGVEWVLDCRELNLSNGEIDTIMDKRNNLLEQATKLKEPKDND